MRVVWGYKYSYRRYNSNQRSTCGGRIAAVDRYDALRKIKETVDAKKKTDFELLLLEKVEK